MGFLASKLEELIGILDKKNRNVQEILPQLKLSVLHLQTYQTRLVEPMTKASAELIVRKQNTLILLHYIEDQVDKFNVR